jgi:hypothetical protein
MNSTETLPAPVLPAPPEDKLLKEQQAFHRLLPELLPTHRDQYVAIHEGRVVDSGPDQIEVAERAYARFGYMPILLTLVTERPRPVIRIPSPRLLSNRDLQDALQIQPGWPTEPLRSGA